MCNLTETKNYKYVFDEKTRSAYIYGGNRQWLGLENPITIFSKASYMKAYNLAGIMIYDLASDDYKVLFDIRAYKIISNCPFPSIPTSPHLLNS